MRNLVFGVIGVLWGGAIVVNTLVNGIASPAGGYGAGQLVAALFGVALLAAGSWTLAKRAR